MGWTQTELLVDAALAIAATVAVAILWTFTLACAGRAFIRELGRALNTHSGPPARSDEVALVCALMLASLASPVLLIWLAWTHHLWLTVAAQLALPLCTLAWLRLARKR
ncbi:MULTISPECIES: hypothetical protein [unclassified Streptomyces]|uniref:hypothetical protein n=1 Tax=unclassified Streptomyces TaxID=2593676 RepID=UPI000710B54A|nr:hypothetical protein [Streptomyces sp. Root1310]KQX77057.1 hypothetical protein ASD48_38390 [Streptomyces sp. Root1310]